MSSTCFKSEGSSSRRRLYYNYVRVRFPCSLAGRRTHFSTY